jgi:2-deoxy-D-gluconate 3-dehydrogenase
VEPTSRSVAEMIDLTGKVAIVTGAAQGLGYEIAARLAEVGAHVVANDLDAERAEEAAKRLGAGAIAAPGDVSDRGDVERMLAAAVDAHGRVDILVNNAAIYPQVPFLESTEEFWSATFRVNMVGTMLCSQVVARKLIDQGEGGCIVNVLSGAAVNTRPDPLAAYGASKAGMLNFTKVLARSLAPHRIRVNALLPGGMETPGVADFGGRRAGTDIPLGHRAHPDEVARGALFLASDLAEYITGVDLLVDGGNSIK